LADDSLDIQFDPTTGIVGLTTETQFPGYLQIPITIPPDSGGNIPSFPAAKTIINWNDFGLNVLMYDSVTSKARVFTKPGKYRWFSKHQGVDGTVVVVPNDSLRRPAVAFP
jgi:hypothetical protein